MVIKGLKLNWFVVWFESLSNIYILYSRRPVCGLSKFRHGRPLATCVKLLVMSPYATSVWGLTVRSGDMNGHRCESAVFKQFTMKAFCTVKWIQSIVPQSAKCFYSKLVKHCALTKINSVTVGTERPRPRMRNICSSPECVAGGWKIQYPFCPCASRELW